MSFGGFMSFAKQIAEEEFKPAPNPGNEASADRSAYVEQCEKAVPSDVRMFSGCKDAQTSADVHDISEFGLPPANGPSGAGGACTNALSLALENEPDLSWVGLLDEMRKILKTKGYSQIPQLTASRDMNLNEKFSLINPEGEGKKKALLIGINYVGQNGELGGCINDVERIQKLIEKNGFEEIQVMTDETSAKPTYKNIMNGLLWLADGAQAGDSLFMHYSGHGGRMKDQDGDEADGYDETMIPIDYQKAGQMRDDDIFKALIAPLPEGVHLTVIMDCCHSGSILDLPFMLEGNDDNMTAFESGEEMQMGANPGFNIEFVLKIAKTLYKLYTGGGGDSSEGSGTKSVGTDLFASAISGGFGGTKEEEEEEDDDPVKKFGGFAKSFW